MDFSKASLAELRQFTKDNGIKGCSGMKKAELAQFLIKYVEEHVTAVSVENKKNVSEPKTEHVVRETAGDTEYRKTRIVHHSEGSRGDDFRENNGQRRMRRMATYQDHSQNQERYQDRGQNQDRNQERYQDRGQSQERYQDRGQNQDRVQSNQAAQNVNEYLPELDSGRQAHGILEVMPEGYGFIRSANYLPGDQDIYVSPAQIRRFGLKTGDIVTGNIRNKTQGEKFSALLYVASVNDEDPVVIAARKSFEEMTPIFPNERIELDGDGAPIPIRMINLLAPIGKGQRGMIVSPPKTGKTTLLKQIAKQISRRYEDMHLLVLLIDERPEEVTDIRESIEGPNVEVIYSTFDELPEHHKRVSEMVIERAKRLVESKKDVVILLDSITRLARAYNLTVAPSGRTLSGGLDPAALHMPKRFFGAARNMREGGSLTILATALVDTGSKMDDVVFEEFKGTGNMELQLDRSLSNKRIFPAVNLISSSTRRDDLLQDKTTLDRMWILRKYLSDMNSIEAMSTIHKNMQHTRNNDEFLLSMNS